MEISRHFHAELKKVFHYQLTNHHSHHSLENIDVNIVLID
jgi:hypothetical protein